MRKQICRKMKKNESTDGRLSEYDKGGQTASISRTRFWRICGERNVMMIRYGANEDACGVAKVAVFQGFDKKLVRVMFV